MENKIKKINYIMKPNKDSTNFILAEVNLERLPYFVPDKRKKYNKLKQVLIYTKNSIVDGNIVKLSWKVSADQELGLPNHFDRDVYRCIQKIIIEQGLQSNGLVAFSINKIIQMLGYKKSGYIRKKIKESCKRLVATTIQSKGAFYYKGEKTQIGETFHLFDRFVEREEYLSDGIYAETYYIKLGDWLLKSVQSGYLKPVDFEYYINLKSSRAKAIYSRLSTDFYGLPDDANFLKKRYSKLCEETLITYQKYPSYAKRDLKNTFTELIKTGFLSKVEFETIPNERKDFYIKFYPSKRAKEPNNFKTIYPKAVEVFEPKFEPQQDKKLLTINKNNTPKQEIIDIVDSVKDELSEEDQFILNGLLDIYVSELTALECVKNYKEKTKYWLEAKKYDGRYQKASTKAGFIITAIKCNWVSPEYEQHLQREKQQEIVKIQTKKEELEKRRRELEKQEENLKLEEFYNSLPKPEQEKIELDILDKLKKENAFLYNKYKKEGLTIGIKSVLNHYRYEELKNLKGL